MHKRIISCVVLLHLAMMAAWYMEAIAWLCLLCTCAAPVIWWWTQRDTTPRDLSHWDDSNSYTPWDFRG